MGVNVCKLSHAYECAALCVDCGDDKVMTHPEPLHMLLGHREEAHTLCNTEINILK